ncbi:1,4-alpha-glucan branching enzyme GlgB OS=Streptomyces paromomycinus OX=92743 GN=glgB1 PE=3 SV=1 [Streptomyces rimosus subsp. rimosus]
MTARSSSRRPSQETAPARGPAARGESPEATAARSGVPATFLPVRDDPAGSGGAASSTAAPAPAATGTPPSAERPPHQRDHGEPLLEDTRPGSAEPAAEPSGGSRGVRTAPPLDPGDRDRLLSGAHHDPHALLGAHPLRGGVLFRVLRPYAKAVTVLAKGLRADLHDEGDGLFGGVLPLAAIPEYELLVSYDDNDVTVHDPYRFLPAVGELDLHLFGEGRHEELWQAMGAMPMVHQEVTGTRFTVWAPNARGVRVVGNFNYWDGTGFPMRSLGSSGVWELFLPGIGEGELYKFGSPGRTGRGRCAPTRWRAVRSARPPTPPSCTPRTTGGRTRRGWSGAPSGRCTRRRSPSTRCTSAPGVRG